MRAERDSRERQGRWLRELDGKGSWYRWRKIGQVTERHTIPGFIPAAWCVRVANRGNDTAIYNTHQGQANGFVRPLYGYVGGIGSRALNPNVHFSTLKRFSNRMYRIPAWTGTLCAQKQHRDCAHFSVNTRRRILLLSARVTSKSAEFPTKGIRCNPSKFHQRRLRDEEEVEAWFQRSIMIVHIVLNARRVEPQTPVLFK